MPRTVVLNWGPCCPPEDIWQHLKTLLVAQRRDRVGRYWQLVGRSQGCCYILYSAENNFFPAQLRIIQPKMSSAIIRKLWPRDIFLIL